MISNIYHVVKEKLSQKGALKYMPERKVALLLRIRPGLKERLVDLAKHEHRSLNQQIEFLLEQSLPDTIDKQPKEQQSRKGARG
jgi:hypothetical protein